MKRKLSMAIVCLCLFCQILLPSYAFADNFEAVYLYNYSSLDNMALIVRSNGDIYAINYGIGALSIWRYKGGAVYISSPGIFLGVGSTLVLPNGKTARIWGSEYLGNCYY